MKTARSFICTVLCLILLIACDSNDQYREESKLINGYISNIQRVLQAHSNGINNAKTLADYELQQGVSLDNLAKVKAGFQKYPTFSELQAVITTVDFALSRLFVRNQQIFALSAPIWKEGDEKLNKLKDPEYYAYHQRTLSELHAMMEEFISILKEHKTEVRQKMLSTDLSEERRKMLWPALSRLLSEHITSFRPQIYVIRQSAENEAKRADFLFENREKYEFSQQSGLIFNNAVLASRYNSMLQTMQYWQNDANDKLHRGF
ncbi:DUF3053 family protein [Aliiglaciecola sp. LCG003]|uniref:DUF3053 family protein n=1 Tax=Aliiglaciecola sp. LCG003 TaxID=3053655 RepID=UPI0025732E0F|nr:DUF3053 family protein [Aliiglaciecola sp. LCG003]WJG09697.1 DUF3053 family protein [Aliiglaciecola sp. LCG003]